MKSDCGIAMFSSNAWRILPYGLLHLLIVLRKIYKCEASGEFFHNEFDQFNNTGAQLLDSIYHMTLKINKNCIFGLKTS